MKYDIQKENNIITITIDNECGLKATLTNIGASIVSITFNNQLMTLTPKKMTDFVKPNIYYGKTVGPFPGRVKDGLIDIKGTQYQLDQNEGNNCLHSGKYGLSNQIFKYDVIKQKGFIGVNFMLTKKNKIDGVPGKIVYTIGYVMQEGDNTLNVFMRASSNEDTIIGLTNHSYFTLGESKVDALKLTIPAHKFIVTGEEDLLPHELNIVPPCLDFQKGKRIDKDFQDPFLQEHRSKGYDHSFILDKGEIRLENKKYQLDITTDFESVTIYTDNYADDIPMLGTEEKLHRGVAIEPQDSLLERKLIEKGKVYSRSIRYSFSEK